VRSGRVAILGLGESLEWITPTIYLRGRETHLFAVSGSPDAVAPSPALEERRSEAFAASAEGDVASAVPLLDSVLAEDPDDVAAHQARERVVADAGPPATAADPGTDTAADARTDTAAPALTRMPQGQVSGVESQADVESPTESQPEKIPRLEPDSPPPASPIGPETEPRVSPGRLRPVPDAEPERVDQQLYGHEARSRPRRRIAAVVAGIGALAIGVIAYLVLAPFPSDDRPSNGANQDGTVPLNAASLVAPVHTAGQQALVELPVDGGLSRNIIKLDKTAFPALSGDRGKIAYVLDQQEIRLVAADGSDDRHFVSAAEVDPSCRAIFRPAWDPDGRNLAVPCQTDTGSALFLIAASNKHVRKILDRDGAVQMDDVAWSNDGTRLTYWVSQPGGTSIAILRIGETEPKLLTEPGDYADPTWSPNDELIAYRYETHIWVMDSNGHNRRPLTDGTLDQDPSWSPDGHRLAFKHQSASGTNDVWVINLDGTNARGITDSPDLDESAPAWSRR
jgi:hypothetical protein